MDEALHTSLTWAMDNSIEGVLFETFSVELAASGGGSGASGSSEVVELCAGGAAVEVTDENKADYARLRAAWTLEVRILQCILFDF